MFNFNNKVKPQSRGERMLNMALNSICENNIVEVVSNPVSYEETLSTSPGSSLTELQTVNPWHAEDTDYDVTSKNDFVWNENEEEQATNLFPCDMSDNDVDDPNYLPSSEISEDSTIGELCPSINYCERKLLFNENECSIVHNQQQEVSRLCVTSAISEKHISLVPYSDTESDEESKKNCDTTEENHVDEFQQDRGQRKRRKKESEWTRNKAKNCRNNGQEYINRDGKHFAARVVQNVDCSKCKFKCFENYSEDDRKSINKAFWSSGSYERRGDFICKYVKTAAITRRRPDTKTCEALKKNNSFKYLLPGEHRVCKKFFLRTLDISQKTVQVAKGKEKSDSSIIYNDMRGRHEPKNKTPSDSIKFVKNHIDSFPKMESHYCRSSSKRQYLSADLNLVKMYELYLEKCQTNNVVPVKLNVYRTVFNTQYNLSFHHPKKDTCRLCEKMKNMTDHEKSNNQETFDNHMRHKILARQEKENDKEKAKNCSTFMSFTFDLQSVLYSPCSQVSSFYYTRKFCSYNLTFYDQANGNGKCFFWTETNGKRGSNEIGTAIYCLLENLPKEVDHVAFFSDSCGGQNRNRYIATVLLHAVRNLPVKIIDLKFLETGHTQMEVDSIHSAIEIAKKNRPVYSPVEWPTIIRNARRRRPYEVHVLSFSDIYDLKKLKKMIIKNDLSNDANGTAVNWMKIKFLRFQKATPDYISIKTNFDQEDFTLIPTYGIKKTRKQSSLEMTAVPRKYSNLLPVSERKKQDLVQLCRSGVIPNMYHDIYMSLPTSKSIIESLPEPDMNESDSEIEDGEK